MKSDFYVPVVRQVSLDNAPLRNGNSSQNLTNDQKYPHKMIVCSGGRFWNFLQGFKVASFI